MRGQTRRLLIGLVLGVLLAVPLAAEAQPAGQVYRIGFLSGTTASVAGPLRRFRQGLRDPGPAGNTTGVAVLGSDLAPKRLQLLKEIMPTLRRVAVLLNTRNPASREDLRQTEAAARRLDVTVRVFEVREPAEFETAFTAIARERPDGLIVVTDPLTASHIAHIVEFAARNRLPAMYTVNAFVLNSGGLISYGTESSETWRRAAWYVNRILKGAKPADLPVEQPTKFELVRPPTLSASAAPSAPDAIPTRGALPSWALCRLRSWAS